MQTSLFAYFAVYFNLFVVFNVKRSYDFQFCNVLVIFHGIRMKHWPLHSISGVTAIDGKRGHIIRNVESWLCLNSSCGGRTSEKLLNHSQQLIRVSFFRRRLFEDVFKLLIIWYVGRMSSCRVNFA